MGNNVNNIGTIKANAADDKCFANYCFFFLIIASLITCTNIVIQEIVKSIPYTDIYDIMLQITS